MGWLEDNRQWSEELTRPRGIESLVRAGRTPSIHMSCIGGGDCFLIYVPPEEMGPESKLVWEDGGLVCYFGGDDDVGTPCRTVEVSIEEGEALISRIQKEGEAMRREALPWWRRLSERLLGRRCKKKRPFLLV